MLLNLVMCVSIAGGAKNLPLYISNKGGFLPPHSCSKSAALCCRMCVLVVSLLTSRGKHDEAQSTHVAESAGLTSLLRNVLLHSNSYSQEGLILMLCMQLRCLSSSSA
jgi:hypothetical protein